MNSRILYSMFYDMLEQEHEAFKSDDGLAVLCPKSPLWIWLAQDRNEADARLFFNSFLQKNASRFASEPLIGLVAEENIALACASEYARQTGLYYSFNELIAYYLPHDRALAELNKPVAGELRIAGPAELPLVQEWISAFYTETLNAPPPQMEEQSDNPPPLIEVKPRLFIWWDSQPVAMGMLTGISGKTCRLNLIYTPPKLRGKKYGRALVIALVNLIRENNQVPILYTAGDNIASNNLYQSIGFQEAGKLTEVRFFE